jgi:ABC-type transport system substrate-binding protein
MKHLILALTLGLSLGAQIVQESFSRDPGPLDFIRGEGLEQFILQAMSGDALVGMNAKGDIVPRLAAKWQRLPKGLRFELRGDARFSDGSPVRAQDVVWTFQALQTDPKASPTKHGLSQGLQVISQALGIEIHSEKPANRLLMDLANIPIAKAHQPQVGSGPFSLKASSGTWELHPRAHFLNPKIKGLRFRLLADEQAILLNLQKGWLSIGVPPIRKGLSPPPSHRELIQPTHAQLLVWNRLEPGVLRLFEGLRSKLLPPEGLGPRCKCSQGLWPTSLGFQPQSILPGKVPPKGACWEMIYTAGDGTTQTLLMALREQARQAGYQINLKPVEAGLFYDRLLHGRFQLACAINLFEPHPWGVLELMEPQGALNFCHWSHPHLAALLPQLQNPSSAAWQVLSNLWAEAPTALPLVDFQSVVWVDRHLKVEPSPLGLYLTTPGAAGWTWVP